MEYNTRRITETSTETTTWVLKKARLLACESIYGINMNADMENTVKIVLHVLLFSRHSPREESFTMRHRANQEK